MLDIDVKDFQILDEIFRTGSVTATAEKIGLGQSSISIRLGKLRKHFNDPLFVRTSDGMQPTPRLEAMIPAVRNALALCTGEAGLPQPFDPATAERLFRICMTDVGQTVILPRLQAHLRSAAPGVRLDAVNLSESAALLLESGEADLAMGFTLDIPAPFYQQRLFEEGFVCLASGEHPRLQGGMSMDDFLHEQHLDVRLPPGTGHGILDKALQEQGVVRNVVLRVPSFLGVAGIVAQSDLLAIVPLHLGRILAVDKQLRLFALPFPLPTYPVKQFWHERYHRDFANQWLRSVVASIFVE